MYTPSQEPVADGLVVSTLGSESDDPGSIPSWGEL